MSEGAGDGVFCSWYSAWLIEAVAQMLIILDKRQNEKCWPGLRLLFQIILRVLFILSRREGF